MGKSEVTRQLLMDEAMRLFANRGVNAVSLKEIGDAA
jgi:AcrR family transcriptional regulator